MRKTDFTSTTRAISVMSPPSGLAGISNHRADTSRRAELPPKAIAVAMATPVLRGLLPVGVTLTCNATGVSREPAAEGEEILLLSCTRGCGWMELGGQRHLIRTGDFAVIPPKAPRTCGAHAGRPWTYFSVHVTGTNLKFFLSYLGVSLEHPVLRVGEDPRLHGWILELLELVGKDCKTAELIYASQTLAHLLSALICRNRKNEGHENGTTRGIEDSIAYMKQHLDEPLRAASLAGIARMSLPHYFVLFKQETGFTPIDFFINLRMNHARHLLSATSWSVKEVAAALGYEDPLYFSRVFKSVHRLAPTEFRLKPKASSLDRAADGQAPTLVSNGIKSSAVR